MHVLVEFSVEKFLSLREKQRFSMVAAEDRASDKGVIGAVNLNDDKLLAGRLP